MQVIFGGQGKGKTTALIKIAAETGAYIVCRNQQTAQDIFEKAQNMGLIIFYPITYLEFRTFRPTVVKGRIEQSLVIDDIEAFVQSLTPITIKAFTMDLETL